MNGSIEVLVDDAVYTEAPRWHDGALWFSDLGAGQVCRIASDGKKEVVLSGLDTPSGLGWTRSGDLLICSINTSTIYRVGPDGAPRVFCGLDTHGALATNDMATAGSRSYVTCSGRVFQPGDDLAALSQPVGKILLLDHDTGVCRTVATELKMPNGVAISADGRTLVVAEVFAARILEFDIHADGSLSEPRVFVDLGHGLDGLALDAEGAIWLGAGAEGFRRIDASGKLAEVIEVPGWMCIACMLGGPDGKSLFMAVSQFEDADAIFNGRSKGRILSIRVAAPAAPEADFGPT